MNTAAAPLSGRAVRRVRHLPSRDDVGGRRLVLVQGPARFAIAVGCTSEHAQEARRRWPLTEEELARIDFRQFVREYPELAVTMAGLLELARGGERMSALAARRRRPRARRLPAASRGVARDRARRGPAAPARHARDRPRGPAPRGAPRPPRGDGAARRPRARTRRGDRRRDAPRHPPLRARPPRGRRRLALEDGAVHELSRRELVDEAFRLFARPPAPPVEITVEDVLGGVPRLGRDHRRRGRARRARRSARRGVGTDRRAMRALRRRGPRRRRGQLTLAVFTFTDRALSKRAWRFVAPSDVTAKTGKPSKLASLLLEGEEPVALSRLRDAPVRGAPLANPRRAGARRDPEPAGGGGPYFAPRLDRKRSELQLEQIAPTLLPDARRDHRQAAAAHAGRRGRTGRRPGRRRTCARARRADGRRRPRDDDRRDRRHVHRRVPGGAPMTIVAHEGRPRARRAARHRCRRARRRRPRPARARARAERRSPLRARVRADLSPLYLVMRSPTRTLVVHARWR